MSLLRNLYTALRYRRGWVVPLAMLLTAAVAALVAQLRSQDAAAEAVLLAPVATASRGVGDADDARNLALTYERLLPADEEVASRVASRLRLPASVVRGRITTERRGQTSLLTVSFRSTDSGQAVRGARSVAAAVTGPAPVSPNFGRNTISVVRLPTSASNRLSGGSVRADAVLLVSTASGGGGPQIDPTTANSVAANYAGLIPEDQELARAVGRDLGVPAQVVRRQTTAVNDINTSLLRVRFRDPVPERALAGASSLARSLTGATPASSRVAPASLVVTRPAQLGEDRTGVPVRTIVVGLFLGLCLGVVLMIAWQRRDPNVETATLLADEVHCPATSLEKVSTTALAALLDRWRALAYATDPKMAVLAATPGVEFAAEEIVQVLLKVDSDARGEPPSGADGAGGGGLRIEAASLPGGDHAGEAVALGSDLVVLVVRQGTRVSQLGSALTLLKEFGITPGWALLVPRSRRRQDPPSTPTSSERTLVGGRYTRVRDSQL